MVDAKKNHNLIYLGFILILSSLLKIPSLVEPNHYGDEGIYQVIGQAIHRGAFLYRDIWDNKPPFLYLTYSLLDGDQFALRFLSLIFTLLSIVVFYFLAQELFKKRFKTTLFITTIFALGFSLPFLEGNIANAENFMILPIVLAFYLAAKNLPKIKNYFPLTCGLLLGTAFLFKIVALFDFAALLLFWIIFFWNSKKTFIRPVFLSSFGFTLPTVAISFFFLTQGVFREFLSAVLSTNVGYVAWGNKLVIAQGWLILKIFILAIFCLLLFLKRKNLASGQLLIFLWFGFSLFNAFFAQRPWTHYLLVLVGPFCLLLGSFLQVGKYRTLTLALILITLYLAGAKFWLYDKTFAYYVNFSNFIFGKKTAEEYRFFWGGHVNRDYRVAEFLTFKTRPTEPVFIWGNNAQIYALAKRPPAAKYVVAYHINFSPQIERETIQSLVQKKPKYFIILLPQSDPLGNLQLLLSYSYRPFFEEEGFIVYERRP